MRTVKWAPAWTDFMPSAVREAPLAADRGESALCATTSICSGDWFFGFWVTVEDSSGEGGNLVTLIERDHSLNLSRTDTLLLDTTVALSTFDLCFKQFSAQIIIAVFFFSSITLPKTPAIQHAEIKNKSNWCPCKICCQFQTWTPYLCTVVLCVCIHYVVCTALMGPHMQPP